mgnify:CR=1 FL=1
MVPRTDRYGAVAEVFAVGRGRSGARVVLLLVEPRGLESAARVTEMVERGLSSATVWMFEASANPGLRAVVASDVDAWREAERNAAADDVGGGCFVAAPEVARAESRVEVRGEPRVEVVAGIRERVVRVNGAAGHAKIEPAAPEAAKGAASNGKGLLSQEELAMLLGDDEGEPRG